MPGNYSIKGFVIYNQMINIPEEKITYKTGLFSSETQTIPAINMSSWVKGGIEIDRYEISLNKILSKNIIIVGLIDGGIPSNYNDLNKMSNVLGNLKNESFNPYFESN